MSTTTESEWVSSDHSDSLEAAVRRQATRRQLTQSEASTVGQHQQSNTQQQPTESCRLERLKQSLDAGELLFTSAAAGTTDFGLLLPGITLKREAGAADLTLTANGTVASIMPAGMAGQLGSSQHGSASLGPNNTQGQAAASGAGLPETVQVGSSAFAQFSGNPGNGFPAGDGDLMEWLRAPSPGLGGLLDEHHATDSLLRVPSPPPLPPDWDPHNRTGLLFDFDQFDPAKRAAQNAQRGCEAVSAPMMTVTSGLTPQEVTNPSDDYIWQILFAGENDPVPKRVTAHLHHHPLDFSDDDLDHLLGTDLPNGHAAGQGKAAAAHAPPQDAAPATLESIDAVLAHLHPTPLDEMTGMQLPGKQGAAPQQGSPVYGHQAPHSGDGTLCMTRELSSSPGGSGPNQQPSSDGNHAANAAESIQQVPQAQSAKFVNGFINHNSQPQQPLNGKLKPETSQLMAPCLQQPQQLEIANGVELFGSLM